MAANSDVAGVPPSVSVTFVSSTLVSAAPLTHSGAVAPALTFSTCSAVPIFRNVVVPGAVWYGTEPAKPPARLVAVPIEIDEGATFFQYCSTESYWIRSPLLTVPNWTLLSVPPSTEPGVMRMCMEPEPPEPALTTSPM